MKWKPKYDEIYYYIVLDGHNAPLIDFTYWMGNNLDFGMYKLGNCFRTTKEATDKLKLIKKILKA